MLTAQVGDAMVRAINAVKKAPVTGLPLLFAIETGDNSDNCQYNEVRWNIDVLDGERIVPDSGDLHRYEGVMDADPLYYDDHYWHPGGTPPGKSVDRYRGEYGFPTLPTLLDAARKPFTAAGLCIPWYTCFGNHDGLSQGNFPTQHAADVDAGHRVGQGDLARRPASPPPTSSTRRAPPSTPCSGRSPSRRTPSW